MATTGRWFINPDGAKVNFAATTADLNVTTDAVLRDIREVRLNPSGSRPHVSLFRGAGTVLVAADRTTATANQDDAAVPTNLGSVPDRPSGRLAAIPDTPTAGAATAANNATTVNAILAALRTHGIVAP